MRKIIGVTGPSVHSESINELVENYFNACPLFINQNNEEDLRYLISQVNGVVLAGGVDLFPGTYGANVTYGDGLSKFDIRRDKRELFLIDECIKQNKPILGICRGFQLVCVKFGHSLITNITGTEIAHSLGEIKLNYEFGEFAHYLNCLPQYKAKYFDKEGGNSLHHQAVPYYPKQFSELDVVATADTYTDSKKNFKIVEIVENERLKIVAAQNHPELDYMYGNIPSNKVLERFKGFLV